MCLARVMMAGRRQSGAEVATDVAHIQSTEEGLVVTDLLGRQRTVEAGIESIDFIESTVVLRRRRN